MKGSRVPFFFGFVCFAFVLVISLCAQVLISCTNVVFLSCVQNLDILSVTQVFVWTLQCTN